MRISERYEARPGTRTRMLAAAVVTVLGLAAVSARADDLAELRQRLDAQEQQIKAQERRLAERDATGSNAEPAQLEQQQQQIKVLERKLELNEETARTAAASTATVKASPKGFSIQSADGANVVKLRGTLHFDGRYFLDDTAPDLSDTWILRRVRPTLEGTLNNIWDFRFTPDFAGGKTIILDAFGAVRLKPWAVVTAGKFKVPVGLERLVSANDLKFIERGFPTILVPNRDLGVSLGGDIAGGAVQYSAGVFNGVVDGNSSDAQADVETDNDRDWAARVFFQPFLNSDNFALRGLGFGVAATYVDALGNVQNPGLPTYRNPDQQSFFRFRGDIASTPNINETVFIDGERLRVTPQAYYYVGSFGALGEYVHVTTPVSRDTAAGRRHDDLDIEAWQISLSYFLTGEEAAFKGFTPNTTFNLEKGTWGAFEVVARYNQLSIDEAAFAGGALSYVDPATSPSKATEVAVGLNWYFNQNFKWQVDYAQVSYEGGAPNGGDRGDSKVVLTRFAVGF
ncbi:MAG TPA: porin [Povalibacter sp.]|nr:porin [Povalibacter sp.]